MDGGRRGRKGLEKGEGLGRVGGVGVWRGKGAEWGGDDGRGRWRKEGREEEEGQRRVEAATTHLLPRSAPSTTKVAIGQKGGKNASVCSHIQSLYLRLVYFRPRSGVQSVIPVGVSYPMRRWPA